MPQHEAFLNPKLSLDIQDRYIARSTVLHALPAQPHHFHSTFLSIGSGVQPYRSLITAESIREEHHVGMDLEDEHVDSTMATELLEACRSSGGVLRGPPRIAARWPTIPHRTFSGALA